jgi:hypothetical protein
VKWRSDSWRIYLVGHGDWQERRFLGQGDVRPSIFFYLPCPRENLILYYTKLLEPATFSNINGPNISQRRFVLN